MAILIKMEGAGIVDYVDWTQGGVSYRGPVTCAPMDVQREHALEQKIGRSKGGDRDLAERLLFEHGLDPDFHPDVLPEAVEVAAGMGHLDQLAAGACSTCFAGPEEDCDAALHC